MKNSAENNVSTFYNEVGWESEGEATEDARRFEDLRENAQEYISQCRLRIFRHIPDQGKNILDMASGPIQYPEYLKFSENYETRYCVDLSAKALRDAKSKIGDHGVFLCGSFFDIDLEDNFFDCAISLHTIYHMDKNKQEEAVRKLIRVTKPGKPIIIIYSNPNTFTEYLIAPLRSIKNILTSLKKNLSNGEQQDKLYFFSHPLSWWKRFEDEVDIEMLPWRSFYGPQQKILIPNNKLGKKILEILFNLEEKFPNFFVKHFQYPMLILKKKENLVD